MDDEAVNWDDYLQIASRSDVGMRRSNNQDNLSISVASSLEQWRKHGHFFVVADGMGAHAAGELASKLAADNLSHLFVRNSSEPIDVGLRKSIEQTNLEIHRRGQANPEFYNMGTTCSSLAFTTAGAVVGHVGDSRVYRVRGNRLEQLTFDHSLVWEMRASGQMKGMADGGAAIPKNVITRSLGPYAEVKVDIEGPFPLEPGDTFLLCSDGLTGPVQDDELGPLISVLPPDEAAQTLVNLANLRGGPDNITVVLVKVLAKLGSKPGELIRPDQSESSSLMLPISWAVFGILAICAVIFGLMSASWMGAAVPGIAAVLALVVAIVVTLRQIKPDLATAKGGAFGKAPYMQMPLSFSKELSSRLSHLVEELLATSKREKWTLRWAEIESSLNQIKALEQQSQLPEVIAGYARLLNRIMSQVRRQRQA